MVFVCLYFSVEEPTGNRSDFLSQSQWNEIFKPVLTHNLIFLIPKYIAAFLVNQGDLAAGIYCHEHHAGDIKVFLSRVPFMPECFPALTEVSKDKLIRSGESGIDNCLEDKTERGQLCKVFCHEHSFVIRFDNGGEHANSGSDCHGSNQ